MSEPKPVKRKRQSENEEGGRKRRRFNKSNEPNKKFPLPTFARSGIICTCDQNNRIRCGWEARTILQEEFERKFGEFCPVQYNVAHPSISDASESISDMLNKELNDQKGGVSISNPKERLWEFTTTKCKGIEYLEIQPKEGSDKKDVDIKMDVKTDNLIERNKDVESQDDDVEEEEEEDDEEVGEDQFVSQVQKGKTDDE
ncbi:MAG: hypothetical protein EZS28_032760 [Streblomastix strix]|uniref:Uncharacterized protein n=1 Tax=Streblomastix strix TaxID=222440 RepID=A0A5J4UNS2_9EUKA|nr:MAG: hypothetical protein EZS28_032760 [Streblomastix strix]